MTRATDFVQAHAALFRTGTDILSGNTANVVWGVTDRVIFGSRPFAINNIRQILIESEQVYLYDANVVLELRSASQGHRLIPLMQGDTLVSGAPTHLAGLFHCAIQGEKTTVTYQPPPKVVAEVLNCGNTKDLLPRIDWYCRRPVFDQAYNLCGPGYHAAERILIHGDDVIPSTWSPPAAERPIDRLPPGLQGLLRNFCFASPADLVSAVAMLLSGVLMNHLVGAGKPVFLINGNQPGIGKSLLANVIGIVLDGTEPPLIHHTEDQDELAKRLGAHIRPGAPLSLLFFDNMKGSIGGSLLESLALASRVSVRRLGHNEMICHANDFIWVFTVNNAVATTDMAKRSVLVHLCFEGDPSRRFVGTGTEEETLKRYARENRAQILGELYAMVIRWRQAGMPGMPPDKQRHRCLRWAELIGGILRVAGLPEFLDNQQEAIAAIDEDLQELTTLAEYIVSNNLADFFSDAATGPAPDFGKTSREWCSIFRCASLRQAELANRTEHGRATVIGRFFGARIERSVPIQVGERMGTATLRRQPAGNRQHRFWIEVTWDPTVPTQVMPLPENNNPGGPATSFAAEQPVASSTPAPMPGQMIPPPATSSCMPQQVNQIPAAPATGSLATPGSSARDSNVQGNDLEW